MTNEEALKQIGHLVGTRYVPSVKAYICELTDRARVVGAGEVATREFDPQRIQIASDGNGMIRSFEFN
jgi:hypothetical protein